MTWTRQEIRRRRIAKDWTQTELAEACGVSRRAVTNWETGVARPQGVNLEALDRVLGDAPIPEPTLRNATEEELAFEWLRRIHARNRAQDEPEVELPAEDLAWPRRKGRVNRAERRAHKDGRT